jgi:hypothetical protein
MCSKSFDPDAPSQRIYLQRSESIISWTKLTISLKASNHIVFGCGSSIKTYYLDLLQHVSCSNSESCTHIESFHLLSPGVSAKPCQHWHSVVVLQNSPTVNMLARQAVSIRLQNLCAMQCRLILSVFCIYILNLADNRKQIQIEPPLPPHRDSKHLLYLLSLSQIDIFCLRFSPHYIVNSSFEASPASRKPKRLSL